MKNVNDLPCGEAIARVNIAVVEFGGVHNNLLAFLLPFNSCEQCDFHHLDGCRAAIDALDYPVRADRKEEEVTE